MAIASKLKTIYDSCKDIRDVITGKNSSFGKGNITTLGNDVTKICNPNNYIHKVNINPQELQHLDNENITIENYGNTGKTKTRGVIYIPLAGAYNWTATFTINDGSILQYTCGMTAAAPTTGVDMIAIAQSGWKTTGSGTASYSTADNCNYLYLLATYIDGETGIPTFEEFISNATFSLTAYGKNGIVRDDDYVGLNYTSVSSAKYQNDINLSNVIISDTVTTIGANAFNGCYNLQYINLENVKTLASQSFMNCKSLKTLNMPNLTTINTQSVFLGSGLVSVIDLGKIVTLTGNSNGSNYGTFSDCTSLETVVLPNTCTAIGQNVFRGCTSLKSINLENIKTLGDRCFWECKSLPIDINIPNLTGQLWYNFNKCNSIKNIVNLGSCTGIYGISAGYDGTFANCSSLETVVLPETCKWLGNNAFYNCTSLRSINLNYITGCNVGYRQFSYCTSLAIDVEMPLLTGNVPSQFFNFSAITSVKNLGSIKSITTASHYNSGAFSHCNSLIYVILPETITSIGTYAFYRCSALTTVTCNAETPPTLASNSFNYCSALTNIYVPADSVAAYQSASGWSEYASKISAIPT